MSFNKFSLSAISVAAALTFAPAVLAAPTNTNKL